MKKFNYGKAICYSGFREGQSPITKQYPSYENILEDLLILDSKWDYIRLYDPSVHAETVLKVISENNINLQVMLGVDLRGEESNPNCAWGGDYTKDQIKQHIIINKNSIAKAINLAKKYSEIIFSVSAGNESVPEWNENLVSPEKVLEYVKELKRNIVQPVTYCDGYHYWNTILKEVAKEVDFLSIHTYPAWEGYKIEDAFKKSIESYNSVLNKYPQKECIITEAGWPSMSDGNRMVKENVGENYQQKYFKEMHQWSEKNDILLFFFEAFDEPWKGGSNADEPEKHWGIFTVDRIPKKAAK